MPHGFPYNRRFPALKSKRRHEYIEWVEPKEYDPARTLRVSKLEPNTNSDYLLGCFLHTGKVVRAKVVIDEVMGQSRKYGFIEFRNRTAAREVLEQYPDSTKFFVTTLMRKSIRKRAQLLMPGANRLLVRKIKGLMPGANRLLVRKRKRTHSGGDELPKAKARRTR